MISRLKLVVGLGNPGAQYQGTRHNAGFWLVDELAARYGGKFRSDSRSQAEAATITVAGDSVHLLKPMLFMNRSGRPVAVFSRYHDVQPAEILVVHDELDFEPGVLRLKVGGGHGGHNGLRDIIVALGSADFARLRVGIGRPADPRMATAAYVLSRPPGEDERAIREAMIRAADLMATIISGDLARAMNQLNERSLSSERAGKS